METPPIQNLTELIELAQREDLGTGDMTTSLIAAARDEAAFRLRVKQRGVFAGRGVAPAVLRAYDPALQIEWCGASADGQRIDLSPHDLAEIRGPLGSILSVERVLLNFLQRLSGIATLTRSFVDAVAGTGASIFDTRKTTPGWRSLEKYAVRCGGGCNHRFGLFDAVLIKDNHFTAAEKGRPAGAVFDMLNRLASSERKPAFVEVEADSIEQFEALLKVMGIDVILLDNFAVDELRRAVELRDGYGLRDKVQLEASGGITLQTVREVAQTGVDRISVGALTHAAAALDISLERA